MMSVLSSAKSKLRFGGRKGEWASMATGLKQTKQQSGGERKEPLDNVKMEKAVAENKRIYETKCRLTYYMPMLVSVTRCSLSQRLTIHPGHDFRKGVIDEF